LRLGGGGKNSTPQLSLKVFKKGDSNLSASRREEGGNNGTTRRIAGSWGRKGKKKQQPPNQSGAGGPNPKKRKRDVGWSKGITVKTRQKKGRGGRFYGPEKAVKKFSGMGSRLIEAL